MKGEVSELATAFTDADHPYTVRLILYPIKSNDFITSLLRPCLKDWVLPVVSPLCSLALDQDGRQPCEYGNRECDRKN